MRPSSFDDHDKPAASADAPKVRRLLVLPIDVERANAELIGLWLAAEGWDIEFIRQSDHGVAIVLIEIGFPRREDRQRIHALSRAWPGVPMVVLSPTFFQDVPGRGRVADELGATAVLATPLQRARLVAVFRDLLGPMPSVTPCVTP